VAIPGIQPSSCPLKPKTYKQVLDYANVTVAVSGLLLQFTRGRDEFRVSIAPAHEPDDSYELGEAIPPKGRRWARSLLASDS